MNVTELVHGLRKTFQQGITRPLAYRQQQLAGLRRFLDEHENEVVNALHADLGKPRVESLSAEIAVVRAELAYTQKHLSRWMRPVKVSTPLIAQPGQSKIYSEPLGVVLIIAPWNYPVQITLAPLIGALAAGNVVILKPSELAPAVSRLLADKLPNYIDQHCLRIVEGGVPETTALLNEHFDHIFYTGSGRVGEVVMTAAAKHLTPVTLELGGKSPAIVDASANLDVAARRIVWSKFSNAGQTCVAVDYLLVEEHCANALLQKLRQTIVQFYGEQPQTSPDYGRIINAHHYQRLIKLIENSGKIYVGGTGDASQRYIAPTILTDVPPSAPVMQEEIFGPILPVFIVKNVQEAVTFINARPKPLALYLFSDSHAVREDVIANTSSGSVSVNFPMLQLVVPELPFGGVGASGMGAYHGKKSFDTFSHAKSVLIKPSWFDLSVFYPPYGKGFLRLVKWFMCRKP